MFPVWRHFNKEHSKRKQAKYQKHWTKIWLVELYRIYFVLCVGFVKWQWEYVVLKSRGKTLGCWRVGKRWVCFEEICFVLSDCDLPHAECDFVELTGDFFLGCFACYIEIFVSSFTLKQDNACSVVAYVAYKTIMLIWVWVAWHIIYILLWNTGFSVHLFWIFKLFEAPAHYLLRTNHKFFGCFFNIYWLPKRRVCSECDTLC